MNPKMPKKRRKLSSDMENDISSAKRKVELVSAIINDIREEDIQGDYIQAFEPTKVCVKHLDQLYLEYGFNEDSKATLELYKKLIKEFESEYEI